MHLNSGFIQPWVGYILLTEIMCVEHYQNRIQNMFLFMNIFSFFSLYILGQLHPLPIYIRTTAPTSYIYQDNCTHFLYILGQLHPLPIYIRTTAPTSYIYQDNCTPSLYILGQLHPLPISPLSVRTSAPPPYVRIRTTALTTYITFICQDKCTPSLCAHQDNYAPFLLDFKSKSKSAPCLLPSCSQLTFPLFPLLI